MKRYILVITSFAAVTALFTIWTAVGASVSENDCCIKDDGSELSAQNSGAHDDQTDEKNKLEDTGHTDSRDKDLMALMPKTVPGDELSWLSGIWYEACSSPSPYISFSASRDGLYTLTGPEAMPQSVPPVKGAASVNLGDRGFTNITPPEWSDAYLRIKANNEKGLDVELVMFLPEETVWGVAREFKLETCR